MLTTAITRTVGNVAESLAADVLLGRPGDDEQDSHSTDLSRREAQYISELTARRERFQSRSKFDRVSDSLTI